ncbi:TPA: rhodanese-like domain-containing protein [Clostridium perfringens]|uniref:rhodanese-like domain-containing protein n=1 Tax=Clostridium perfringens TaxID=1502 RepID=UPI000E154C28|nr:rhodanese-like domain-containing protein [Clostridium perfringens]EJT6151394.1 rhodanese-like domain-containing protein [Clostridium perfringens]EJT6157079.1 rhodanese-like domain-containing protein [Clostridium perfringens]MDG6884403.1 putative adenylyltransferase/sulfurtransferase MoeZ [Clostridium perfringens]NGT79233.1 rhodanese-like domain-containing protein [Clostridium perfringens]UBK57266.1 rhodanese-like domain-containing protein [Clostridium perfringens]
MKKISLLLLSLTLTASLFIGCGSNNTESKDANTQTSSESSSKIQSEEVSRDISIDESKKLINQGEVTLILDVRDADEFAKGHLKNAIQIPVKELKENLNDIEKFKDELVLVYCRSGKKSAEAINILKENGFKNLVHMKDGISKWDGEVEK